MASYGLNDNLHDQVPLARQADLVLVLNTAKGRGVFAARPIPANTILEQCPVLVLSPEEFEQHVRHTRIYFYTYNWPNPSASAATKQDTSHDTSTRTSPIASKSVTQALPLGLGSLFNHSSQGQNVGWSRDVTRQIITYRTLRFLAEGEELCISYGEDGRLGFVDADAEAVRREAEERLAREEREMLRLGVDEGEGEG